MGDNTYLQLFYPYSMFVVNGLMWIILSFLKCSCCEFTRKKAHLYTTYYLFLENVHSVINQMCVVLSYITCRQSSSVHLISEFSQPTTNVCLYNTMIMSYDFYKFSNCIKSQIIIVFKTIIIKEEIMFYPVEFIVSLFYVHVHFFSLKYSKNSYLYCSISTDLLYLLMFFKI